MQLLAVCSFSWGHLADRMLFSLPSHLQTSCVVLFLPSHFLHCSQSLKPVEPALTCVWSSSSSPSALPWKRTWSSLIWIITSTFYLAPWFYFLLIRACLCPFTLLPNSLPPTKWIVLFSCLHFCRLRYLRSNSPSWAVSLKQHHFQMISLLLIFPCNQSEDFEDRIMSFLHLYPLHLESSEWVLIEVIWEWGPGPVADRDN